MADFKACHKFARISPRKARYVMDLVRNEPVERALETLRFTRRRAAPMISKVIRSALANAVQEGGATAEELVIQKAFVDEGPTWKRWRPRARGMAFPILKRTSHITIVLSEDAKARVQGSGKAATAGSEKSGGTEKKTEKEE